MFKKGRRFTAEFKEEAVRLVLVQGLSISQVARDVGASQTTISKWLARARLKVHIRAAPRASRGTYSPRVTMTFTGASTTEVGIEGVPAAVAQCMVSAVTKIPSTISGQCAVTIKIGP